MTKNLVGFLWGCFLSCNGAMMMFDDDVAFRVGLFGVGSRSAGVLSLRC